MVGKVQKGYECVACLVQSKHTSDQLQEWVTSQQAAATAMLHEAHRQYYRWGM